LQRNSQLKQLARLSLFFSSFFWGLAPPIIKFSLRFISPVTLLFYRCFFASLLFFPFLIFEVKKKRPSLADWGKHILLGFLCTPLTLMLYFLGVNFTSAIDVSVVSILAPIVTVSFPVLNKKAFGNYLGNLLVISSGLVWAFFTLLSKKKSFSHLSSFITASVSFMVGFLILLPFFFANKELRPPKQRFLSTYSQFLLSLCPLSSCLKN